MSFLLLYIGEGKKFDSERIEQMLKHSRNVHDLGDGGEGTLFQCEYRLDNDFTEVRLKDDLETIVIDGMGSASLQAAIDIQRGYDKPIHLIDDGYTFDLLLADVESLSDLYQRIEEAGG